MEGDCKCDIDSQSISDRGPELSRLPLEGIIRPFELKEILPLLLFDRCRRIILFQLFALNHH